MLQYDVSLKAHNTESYTPNYKFLSIDFNLETQVALRAQHNGIRFPQRGMVPPLY